MSHTINVTDLTDQDAMLRVLSEIQKHGASCSLMQDGVEVAKVVPTREKVFDPNGKPSPELVEKRLKVLARMDELAKKVTELWCTDETAVEAVQNNRREYGERSNEVAINCLN